MTPANAKVLRIMLQIQEALDELNKDAQDLLEMETSLHGGYDRLLKKIND